jgi:hypothetical protein
MPVRPSSTQAETAARLVREAEQRVNDTTQVVRDINEEIEAMRLSLTAQNEELLKNPKIEPQPLDVGTYENGLLTETILNSRTISKKVRPDRPTTDYGSTINNQVYWFGSAFEDALLYGPEGLYPTRNVVGLGHYLYREVFDAESAANAVLPDNFPDTGLTPNEQGFLTKVSIPEVRNPLNGELIPDDQVKEVFRNAIRGAFDDDEVNKVLDWWSDRVAETPLGSFWDDLSVVWGKKFPDTPIPEHKFRVFEVGVTDGLLELGYDAVTFKSGITILDVDLIEPISKSTQMSATTYAQKALAAVNLASLSGASEFSKGRYVIRLAAVIEAGEAYVDELMQKLSKAITQNDVALEQLFRQEEALEATLNSDTVSRQLSAQEDAAEQVVRDTDAILKQNDEHPSCL